MDDIRNLLERLNVGLPYREFGPAKRPAWRVLQRLEPWRQDVTPEPRTWSRPEAGPDRGVPFQRPPGPGAGQGGAGRLDLSRYGASPRPRIQARPPSEPSAAVRDS